MVFATVLVNMMGARAWHKPIVEVVLGAQFGDYVELTSRHATRMMLGNLGSSGICWHLCVRWRCDEVRGLLTLLEPFSILNSNKATADSCFQDARKFDFNSDIQTFTTIPTTPIESCAGHSLVRRVCMHR